MERLVARGQSSRLGLILLGSFALAALSFLLSTGTSELRAQGIADAADSIATNASPSIYQLAAERSELSRMDAFVVEYAIRIANGENARELVPQIDAGRQRIKALWKLEKATPVYPGEQNLWVKIDAAWLDVDAAVDRVLHATNFDRTGPEEIMFRDVRPAVDRLSEALVTDLDFNVRHASELASWIASSRKEQRRLAVALNSVSVLFAAIAAVAVTRVVHGYAKMMDTRVTGLEAFSGRVAHDIRSPLASVSLAIDATMRKKTIDQATATMLDRAGRSLQRVAQVVDALLMLARADIHPQEDLRADVRALAEDVIEELRPAAEAKGIALELEPLDSIGIACAPGVLICILSNLIGNAIKYIGDAPIKKVLVKARDLGSKVHIEVLDTGPGIPADLRAHIFDPYVRAAASSIPGMGLGLATVRRLAEAHGGSAGVECGKESGSRFWVELPK